MNPVDDLVERGTRREDGAHASGAKRLGVCLGNDATTENDDILCAARRKRIEDGRKQGVVRAGHDGEPHRIDVFLNRGHRNHVGRLMKPRVHNLKARIAERACHDFGAAIVAVETRLGDEDSNLGRAHRT